MTIYYTMNFEEFLKIGLALGLTFIIVFFIGFERQNIGKSAGISAHVLVALGACAVGILQQYLYNQAIADAAVIMTTNPEASVSIENQRIIAQVIAGIGFLGAGVIMKSDRHIVGLTTAATLWVSAILGLLFGSGYILIGAILGVSIVVFMYARDAFRHINPFKRVDYNYSGDKKEKTE